MGMLHSNILGSVGNWRVGHSWSPRICPSNCVRCGKVQKGWVEGVWTHFQAEYGSASPGLSWSLMDTGLHVTSSPLMWAGMLTQSCSLGLEPNHTQQECTLHASVSTKHPREPTTQEIINCGRLFMQGHMLPLPKPVQLPTCVFSLNLHGSPPLPPGNEVQSVKQPEHPGRQRAAAFVQTPTCR